MRRATRRYHHLGHGRCCETRAFDIAVVHREQGTPRPHEYGARVVAMVGVERDLQGEEDRVAGAEGSSVIHPVLVSRLFSVVEGIAESLSQSLECR